MIKNKEEQKKLMELFFMKYENGNIPRKVELRVEQFHDLVEKFQKLTSDKIEIEKRGDYIDIYTLTGSIDVRLRSDAAPYSTMVIVGLAFEPKRLGTGTKFLNWLKEFSIHHGFQRLMIENCNTDESVAFAIKHGFLPLYQQSIPGLDFELSKSYEIYIDKTLIREIR